jgi:uncharacterized cupin superfamily protein
MMLIERLSPRGEPEITRPAPERLIEGTPEHRTWSVEEDEGLFCGIWESTPGAWAVRYEEWEYCRILTGRSVIEGADGSRLEVGPGDAFLLRPGFAGVWRVIETTRKDYVILCR